MTIEILRRVDQDISAKLVDQDMVSIRVVVALFCKCDPKFLIEPTLWLLEEWKGSAAGNLKWGMVGPNASALSAIKEKTYTRIDREIRSLEAGEMRTFRVLGPSPYAPDFRFDWFVLAGVGSNKFNDTALIEFLLPLPNDDSGWAAIAIWFKTISERFPYDTGYVAPALVFGDDASKSDAGRIIGPIAMRHHGFDVPNNETTSYSIGRLSRGARWLTLLSKDNAKMIDLGAIEKDPAGLRVDRTSKGVVIWASETPEIGDVNRQIDVPGLRAVARHIEPVTFFGDINLLSLFGENAELAERWEKRFFEA